VFTTFAYGANISSWRLKRFGIRAQQTHRAELVNFMMSFDGCLTRLRLFHGSATISPVEGRSVHGVIHVLPERGHFLLDLLELVPLGLYRRIGVTVRLDSGEERLAQVYVANTTAPGGVPRRKYLREILVGAREFGLPDEWVAWLEQQGFEGSRAT